MKTRSKKKRAEPGGRRRSWVPWFMMVALVALILGSIVFPQAAFSEAGKASKGESAPEMGVQAQGEGTEPGSEEAETALGAEITGPEGTEADGIAEEGGQSGQPPAGQAPGEAVGEEVGGNPAGNGVPGSPGPATSDDPSGDPVSLGGQDWKVTSLDIWKDVDAVYPAGYSITLNKTAQPTSLVMEPGETEQVTFTINVGIISTNTFRIEGNIFVKNTGDWPADVTTVQDTVWYKADGPSWLTATSSITTTVPVGPGAIPTGGPHVYSYSGTFTLPVPLSQVTSLSNLIEITISNKPDPPPPGMKSHTFHFRKDFDKPGLSVRNPVLVDEESVSPETGLDYEIKSTTTNGVPAADLDGPWELDPAGAPYTVVITKELTANAAGNYTLLNRAKVGELEDPAEVSIVVRETGPECGGIEGYKYEDTNGNGELDDGDSPWEGVTIQLWRVYDGIVAMNGTEPLDETVTDENGHFQFGCLDPGTYLVSEVLPEGSEPVGTTTRMVTVPAGQTVPVDPPFLNREQEEETGEISGWKYLDADGDGTVDEGEAGLPGVTVGLYRQLEDGVVGQWPETLLGWSLVAETVTGEDGGFSFTELEPGIYLVTEETPEGHYPTSPTSVEVALEGGQSVQVVFLNAPMPRLTGEKIEHPNEEPVEGVEFTLTRAVEDGPVAALTWSETRVTGPDGTFDFGWLMPGSYVLEETVPEGWEPMTDPRLEIDLGPGEIMHLVFINRRIPEKSSIYGFKWLDANGDGAHQAEEPGLGGVYIQLEGPDGFTASTVTGENGLYTFEDLQPGEYLVSETVPAGYYPTSSHEVGVNLDEGESERVDFLNAPYGSIWGLKWDDVDGNGAADPGEATIEGVPIRLMNSEGIVILITHTEADGSYSFPELEAGVYTVEEILPFGYENTAPTYVTLYLAPGETARVDFFNRVPVAGEIITPPIPGPPSVTPPPAPQVAGETLPVTGAQLALLLAGAGLLLALGALLFVIGARVARNQEG